MKVNQNLITSLIVGLACAAAFAFGGPVALLVVAIVMFFSNK